VDLIRDAVRYVFQELIESEATAAIGAERYERTEGRVTERNGHRVRLVSTKAGDVELAIPKLRKASFFPSPSRESVIFRHVRLRPIGGRHRSEEPTDAIE
jgi:transposase-like protein